MQPLGGVRACLRIAEDIGLPVVVSSARVQVGIAAGVALAAALPELPYACGLATVQLLTGDVVADPLLPVDGQLPYAARGRRRTARRLAAAPERIEHWQAPDGRGPAAAGSSLVTDPPTATLARAGRRRARRAAGSPTPCSRPGSRNAPLSFALAADDRAAPAAHPDRRAHRRLPRARHLQGSRRAAAVVTTSGTAAANLHPAVLEAAHAGVPLVASPPTAPPGCAAPAPTRPPTRCGCSARCQRRRPRPTPAGGALDAAVARRRPGPPQLPARRPAGARPDGWRAAGPGRVEARRRPAAPRSCMTPTPTATRRSGPRTVVIAGDDAGPPARGRWPSRPAGRCSPSRAAGPAPGATRSAPTGCCSTPSWAAGSSGSSSRPPDAVPAGQPAAARDDVEVVSVRTAGRWPDRPFRGRPSTSRRRAATSPTTRAGSRSGGRPTPTVARRLDALLADAGRPHAVRRRRRGQRAQPAGGLLFVGASNPIRDLDLMATALRRRRPPDGARQPGPRRHRRHRLDRDRRRARPAAQQPRRSR